MTERPFDGSQDPYADSQTQYPAMPDGTPSVPAMPPQAPPPMPHAGPPPAWNGQAGSHPIAGPPMVTVNQSVVLVQPAKSPVVAGLLAFFFGPLGMLYSTILGAAVMFAVNVVVAIVTLGLGLLLTWPLCVVWAVLATRQQPTVQGGHIQMY